MVAGTKDIKNGIKTATVNESNVAKLSLSLVWVPERESVPPSYELVCVDVRRLERVRSRHEEREKEIKRGVTEFGVA